MSKRVLSFGGGVQTTAMAILVSQGRIAVDEVVFADTGGEKPETYWYMKSYTRPLFKEIGMPFSVVRADPDLVGLCRKSKLIPSTIPNRRWCSDKAKRRPIHKHTGIGVTHLIGFSIDESQRATPRDHTSYPLIELGISSDDCIRLITEYGWPLPLKSSCYFCPFQRWTEWNWLKIHHPELIQACIDMEMNYYSRRPEARKMYGLFSGKPLWMWAEGIQMEWEFPGEYSCWSGDCGH